MVKAKGIDGMTIAELDAAIADAVATRDATLARLNDLIVARDRKTADGTEPRLADPLAARRSRAATDTRKG